MSRHLDGLTKRSYGLGEIFFRNKCVCAHFKTVVVNRLWRAMQEFGNLDAVGYTQAYEGINAQVGVEEFALLRSNALVGLEKGVEIVDEIGIYVQENGIERTVEVFQFVAHHVGAVGIFEYLFVFF